ncbi:hypothetical protein AL048_26220 [Pseudomonas syringae pv. castaneae]|nr:hypothetical protein AL048_26220 [Pseudomonas syringae pv. castaneae]
MMDLNLSSKGDEVFLTKEPVNISRRKFLLASAGITAGALVIGFGIPITEARAAQMSKPIVPGTRVPAFLEIRPDNTIRLQSPFIEGGQGIFTALAQIIGEELDVYPSSFLVENAPPGKDYQVMEKGRRFTGGSNSVRSSYTTMRKLGAAGRLMLMQAAANEWKVPIQQLTTEPGKVIHQTSGRTATYGELATAAIALPVPDTDSIALRDPSQFRWIGKPVQRLDVLDKSTGKAQYTIDAKVDNMLYAAVQHAPRLGLEVGSLRNEAQVRQLKGVHSVERLPGAVAVVATRWWIAKRAVEGLQVEWTEPGPQSTARYMSATFSTDAFVKELAALTGEGESAETKGDVGSAITGAKKTVSATYHTQNVNHAQLEPPSALARFDEAGNLEVWLPNQAPDRKCEIFCVGPVTVRSHKTLI